MKKGLISMLVLLFVGLQSVFAQSREISGVVTSADDGLSVPGVSVFVKGATSYGTSTDFDGKYTLKVPADAKILVFSFIGMETQEVAINGKTTINVVMKSAAKQVEEVLVVAFGKAKKSAYTGSAVQVNSKDLEKRQVSNVMNALTGKVAGMQVTSGNNQPGTAPTVRIRGVGSFSAGKGPLYVVDGVPFDGDISSINPQDIESTTVLKDAASAALYGARGANGVIMIQTKSGKKGDAKMTVNFSARYGINSRAVPDYDMIDDPRVYSAKYFEGMYNYEMGKENAIHEKALEKAYEGFYGENGLVYVPFTLDPSKGDLFVQDGRRFAMNSAATLGREIVGPDGKTYWLQPDDWQDEAFEANNRQEYNLSVQGKSKNANYYFSLGMLDDKGYIVSSGFKRYTARLRSDFSPVDWMKIGANLSYANTISDYLDGTTSSGSSGNIFAVTSFIAPIYPVYLRGGDKQIMLDKWGHKMYDYGTKQYPGLKRPFLAIANPLANYELDKNSYDADVVSAKGYVDFKPIEGLKITVNMGYDVSSKLNIDKRNVFYGQFAQSGGIISRTIDKRKSLNLQQLVTYTKKVNQHNFDVLLGHEYYKTEFSRLHGSKDGMFDPNNEEINGAIAITAPSASSWGSDYATEGYLGRFQYDFDDKYFASFSFRRDASSNFHPDHRWGNFWSVGASWLISKENFMESVEWVNMLKVKASYGLQGNDAIGSFRYTDMFALSNSNGAYAVGFDRKGNENITWETSKNLNVGLEFDLWNKRLSGSVEVFNREVSDMLFWRPTPLSAGYSGYYDNIGTMANRGVEIVLNSNIINTNDVKWSASANAAMIKNELKKLPEEWEAIEGGYRDGSRVYKVGGSIYDRAYAHYLGVNAEGKPTWQTFNKETGEYGVTDNYETATLKDNRKVYADLSPDVRGGFTTNLEVYGFDLNISTSFQFGGKLYDSVYASLMHGGRQKDAGHGWHKDILNSWTPENTNTDIPMVDYGGQWANAGSDRFLISSDYFSINSITLGYNFSKDIANKLKLSSLRVYLSADNVALFSSRKGLDPRFSHAVGYQAIRTISGGLKLSF